MGPARVDGEGWVAGLAAALLFHLLAAVVLQSVFREGPSWRLGATPADLAAASEPPLALDFALVPEPLSPDRYVEVNPDAPVNPPDQADAFSFQDQQAAAPDPVPGATDEPRIEGKADDSPKILPGDLPGEAIAVVAAAASPAAAPPPVATLTLPPVDLAEPPPAEPAAAAEPEATAAGPDAGPAPAVGALPDELARTLEREVTVVLQSPAPATPAEAAAAEAAASEGRPVPQPRPRLSPVLPGPVMSREGGTRNQGLVAVNARFNEFGAYLQRMWDAIQIQWYRLIDTNRDALVAGSEVRIRFVLDETGAVAELEVQRSDAGMIGTLICRDAIQSRSPFEPFTTEMRRALGDREELLVRFLYY